MLHFFHCPIIRPSLMYTSIRRDLDLADVDHFIPYTLGTEFEEDLNGVWNLILACQSYNRGANGKFARIPSFEHLERLHRRNEFFIESHHPFRETRAM